MIKRVTLKHIAERANVSVSTVSYALNDDSTVALSEETRARIRRIARDLGYVPNSMARALQSSVSHTVGVLLDKPLSNPRYARIAQGIRLGLNEYGYDLLLADTDGEPQSERYVDDARGGRIDGLIFVGHDELRVDADLERAVRRYTIPFVTLDCGETTGDAPFATVDFDYAGGVRQLVQALTERGVDTVVYVRPDVTSRAERLRESALLGAVTDAQATVTIVRTSATDQSIDELERRPSADYGRQLVDRVQQALANGRPDPRRTAVVCSWGSDVEFAYVAARRHDPHLLVGGLAGGTLSEWVWPNLFYSRLPLEEAGRACARLILEELTPGAEHRRVVLAPVLSGSDQP